MEMWHVSMQIMQKISTKSWVLLYWSEFQYDFIGFASSSFTLISVDSKVFWCGYKINDPSSFLHR